MEQKREHTSVASKKKKKKTKIKVNVSHCNIYSFRNEKVFFLSFFFSIYFTHLDCRFNGSYSRCVCISSSSFSCSSCSSAAAVTTFTWWFRPHPPRHGRLRSAHRDRHWTPFLVCRRLLLRFFLIRTLRFFCFVFDALDAFSHQISILRREENDNDE